MDPPPQPFYSFLGPRVVRRATVDCRVDPFAEVLDNLCNELRAWVAAQRQGSKSFLATPSALLLDRGYANRNLLALSTITRRCRFPASDLAPMSWISISRTSQGLRKQAGNMATRWLLDLPTREHVVSDVAFD